MNLAPRYILATSRPWNESMLQALGDSAVLVTRPEDLTPELVRGINPAYLFFPHWSHRIPAEIHEHFPCVIFHMTDLPYGRGGSPLQNLISHGHTNTKITALRCSGALDAGDIYLQEPLDLSGSAQEIFYRSVPIITGMIQRIIRENPVPQPQQGTPVFFTRRTPDQSDLAGITEPSRIYDHIRMLDAEGYPRAFLKLDGNTRMEFRNAQLHHGTVTATVTITNEEKA